ncbi:MAG: N-acetylmannosamine-6-phosphate 2-epimerase [Halanaerobiaceae bacterium]
MSVIDVIKGGLIVSCQALEDEPLHGAEIMAAMANAAKKGGAVGIRANGSEDIKAIKEKVDLPVIGIDKNNEYDSKIYITPTIKEAGEIARAGAEIIAVDATGRLRPGGLRLKEYFEQIRSRFDVAIMGDISTFEEGQKARECGADLIGTTLSGYTEYSRQQDGPDFILLEKLVKNLDIPVIMEGKISRPEEVKKALELGAWAVVVGTAITRPQVITKWFSRVAENS